MADGLRRIHRLNLRGPDPARMTRLRLRLEDAFRTASLPGLPPQALVLVRRLDLGLVDADSEAPRLAARIDERVWNLAASAVCVDAAERADAGVVWFSDALQAHAVLFARLLDGRPPRAWYWRRLFPQVLAETGPAAITRLWLASLETAAGPLGPARLLEAVLQPARIEPLLDALSPDLARRLLHAQGQGPSLVARASAQAGMADGEGAVVGHIAPPPVAPPWRTLIRRAARRWGPHDVRCRCLALQALFGIQPGRLGRADTLQHLDVETWLAAWEHETAVAPARRAGAKGRGTRPAGTRPAAPGEATDETAQGAATPDTGKAVKVATHTPSGPAAQNPSPVQAPGEQGRRTESRAGDTAGRDPATPLSLAWWPSPHAGLGLLIPLWQQLDLGDLLTRHEALLSQDLPTRLLRELARRYRLAPDDPARRLFEHLPAGPAGTRPLARFEAPGAWWRLAAGRGALRRHEKDGVVTLLEPRGRWRLFHGEAARAGTILRDRGLANRPCSASPPPPDATALCHDLLRLGAFYLRRHAGLSLRGLVCRRGRVALTPTHWDVAFALGDTDLRLRRAALDCDPGWVPWLGRVVQFHYLDEE